ncbi:hypothetical protein Taro_045288 [Colocasia esculenta]|uniref:Uncharacterized protein n=1 Tax=Colocasia esculenta TaxID=4460 RepID=A0A843WP28_COLES|nr:hypothetical protein [Colocasia esculenta]
MASTQLTSPKYETGPTELFVGLKADDVLKLMTAMQLASPEDESRPTKSFVGLEADDVNTTDVTRR